MGAFHCLFGAPFRDGENCVDCGMCEATTSEARAEAAEKIRALLRVRAPASERVGRLAVCGKGGVGKSTMVVLLALALRELGRAVLVLDTDESNPSLYRSLGLEQPPPR